MSSLWIILAINWSASVHLTYLSWAERPIFFDPVEQYLPDRSLPFSSPFYGLGVGMHKALNPRYHLSLRFVVMVPKFAKVFEFWYYEYIASLGVKKHLKKFLLEYGVEMGFNSTPLVGFLKKPSLLDRIKYVSPIPTGTQANLFVEFKTKLLGRAHGLRIIIPFAYQPAMKTMNSPAYQILYSLYL